MGETHFSYEKKAVILMLCTNEYQRAIDKLNSFIRKNDYSELVADGCQPSVASVFACIRLGELQERVQALRSVFDDIMYLSRVLDEKEAEILVHSYVTIHGRN